MAYLLSKSSLARQKIKAVDTHDVAELYICPQTVATVITSVLKILKPVGK